MDAQSLVFETQETARLTKSQARKARKDAKVKKGVASSGPLIGRTATQKKYIAALHDGEHIFAIGPAGTGKTYLPARIAAKQLVDGVIEKIIVARVAVSKPRHQLGFLPGKLDAKMRPWLIPIFDGLRAEVGSHTVEQWMQDQRLEIATFEHLRGRTLGNERTFVLLDEAQNATFEDLQLFLTRIGEEAQCVVTGDLEQIDIPNSGLASIVQISQRHRVPMEVVQFEEGDVVRSAFVAAWVRAFSATKAEKVELDQSAKGGTVQNLDRLPDFLHSPRVTKPT